MKHIDIETKLERIHEEARGYVTDQRQVNPDDYGYEYNAFGLEIGDCLLTLQDMIRILEYGITKEIVYEHRDMVTQSHQSDRVKEAIAKNPNIATYNLISFWRMFGGSKAKKQTIQEIKESKKRMKEIKKLLFDEIEKDKGKK